MVRIETDGIEGPDGFVGWQLLTVSIVALGLLWILLLWWQLHREARIAEQILASEEKFRGITQAALHPIVVTDDQGNITYWNDAAESTFGYPAGGSPRSGAGRAPDSATVPRESLGRPCRSARNLTMSQGTGREWKLAAARQDGAEIPVELNVSSFRLKDRWHAVGVMIDLSSRKWYEAQLEERARLSQTLAEIGGVLTREESDRGHAPWLHVRALAAASGSRPHLGARSGNPGTGTESQRRVA